MEQANKDVGLSIIIPCYNSGSFLKESIDSILVQKVYIKLEIIVIDDCSDDMTTIRIINEYKKNHEIKVLRNSVNKGVQYCRSFGLLNAKYDYIMMLDSDDCLPSNVIVEGMNYLEYAVKKLDKDKNIVFVHGLSNMFGDYTGYTISSYPITVDLAVKKHHIYTSIIYRKKDGIGAGFYDEKIEKWQEWSFGISLLNYRYKQGEKNDILFVDNIVHLYRIHNISKRISRKQIDEKKMIKITVEANKEIFQHFYPGISIEKIVDEVDKNKPNRMIDLLYVAANNLNRAIELVNQRKINIDNMELHKFIP